ncbi:MAG: tetratricopeptide repeat protein [Gammaproteobacteria bacterium]|nr:tetratricopeptide repeat protein [Gammaproteobacteria bacterium]
MSVINQMLQDLEQRRNATVIESPLGGLSASGSVLYSSQPINYILLGAMLVLVVIAAFLFGAQGANVAYQETTLSQFPSTIVPKIIEVPSIKNKPVKVVVASNPDSMQSVKTQLANNLTNNKVDPSASTATLAKTALSTTEKSSAVKKPTQTEPVKSQIPQAEDAKQKSDKHYALSTLDLNVEKVAENKIVETADTITTPTVMEKRIRPLSDAQQAQQHFQESVLQLGRGQQDKARSTLDKALLVDPSHIRARETLAALLLNTGRISEASATLRDGLRITPNAASLAKFYARILVDQGDIERSITVLERAMPLVSNDPEYHALLAAFYSRIGKHGQAAQVYQKVLHVRPGVPQWWMGLGLSLESMGESARALASYQRAQRVGGLSAEVNKFVAGRIQTLSITIPVQTSSAGFIEE